MVAPLDVSAGIVAVGSEHPALFHFRDAAFVK